MARVYPLGGASGSATIVEVAQIAKVSTTTVSLAFQENSRISPATRRRVRKIARRLHYIPNQYARSLRAGRTKMLGLLVNDFANPFYASLAQLLEEMVEEQGFRLLVFNSRWTSRRELDAVKRMAELRVEGAFICYSESTGESRRFLDDNVIPHIALDTCPDNAGGAQVLFDLRLAGRLAAAHFHELDCRRPAMLMPRSGRKWRLSAFGHINDGFTGKWIELGHSPASIRRISAELTITAGREVFLSRHRGGPEMDAVLCGNDLCALGVMDAADQAGISVGERLAVMGIDNLPVGTMGRLSLTTIREPVERLAAIAAEALLDGVENRKELTIRQYIEPELIKRTSTLRFRRAAW